MIPSYFFSDSNEILDRIYARLRTGFAGGYPTHCGQYEVTGVRDVTTGYDSRYEDKKSKLPTTPSSQMITFYFGDAVATIRNSGTEPKIKYYVETKGATMDDAKANCEKLAAALIENFLQ